MYGSISELSIPLIYMSKLLYIPHFLNYYSLILSLEIGQYESSIFVPIFQCCIDYSRSFIFPYNHQNQFVNNYKITCWDFGWDCLESMIMLEIIVILVILNLPICEHGISLHLYRSCSCPHRYSVHIWFDLYIFHYFGAI